jgi:hypothetical protein
LAEDRTLPARVHGPVFKIAKRVSQEDLEWTEFADYSQIYNEREC